jgi:protein TonB
LPEHGSNKPAEKPLSAARTEHSKRQRTAATALAKREPRRPPDAAPDASAPARPRPAERQTTPPSLAPPAYPAPSQLASLPPSAASSPAPTSAAPAAPAAISAEYRQALSFWLERNKIYPDAARQRGDEGTALLRFQVRRDGYVFAYQLTRSTGHAALDTAIDQMMRGARLPPFPAGMTQAEIAVSVPIRFTLSR